jgi:hypothetical protein
MAGENHEYGMPPNDGHGQPRVVLIDPSMFGQRPQQRMVSPEVFGTDEWKDQMRAQTALMCADIRNKGAEIFQNALEEIRSGMSQYKISTGDKGGEGRPPMDPSFDDINHGKLQEAYLSVVLRYVKYIDTVCAEDFQFQPPNGINDKKAPENP